MSAGYFDLFGLAPAAGRFFAAGGETEPVAVVSHSLWQSRLGGREAAVRTLRPTRAGASS